MNIYVILLKSDKKRSLRILNLKKSSMRNLQILDAIDGKTIKHNFLNFLLRNKALTQSVLKNYTKGTVGCYLSHMKMWTTIRQKKYKNTIILEDDFKLVNNFYQKVDLVLGELPEDYDICYFFYHPFSYKYYKNFKKFDIYGKKYIRLQVPTWGLVGYMVSLKGADKLIKLCHTMTGHIDNQVSRLILLGKLKAFHSKELLVDTIGSCLYKNPYDIVFDSNTSKGGFFKF